MSEQADTLRARVRVFAVRAVRFVKSLPRDPPTDTVARQLARSSSSISANYHSSGRARSRREFVARLGLVLDEADETYHWLCLLRDASLASGNELTWLLKESGELRAIFYASFKTARRNFRTTSPNR